MWDLPRPGLEPVFPALAGRFLTTAPPGKPRAISKESLVFKWDRLQHPPWSQRIPSPPSRPSTALCGPASGSPHCAGHRRGWGAGRPVREGPDRGAVLGSVGGVHQSYQDEEALQLCSSLEPDLQGSAPPGPEGHPDLPGSRPEAELRHLPQQQSHRQPLAVPAILPGVSDFFFIHNI